MLLFVLLLLHRLLRLMARFRTKMNMYVSRKAAYNDLERFSCRVCHSIYIYIESDIYSFLNDQRAICREFLGKYFAQTMWKGEPRYELLINLPAT